MQLGPTHGDTEHQVARPSEEMTDAARQ